MTRKSVLVGVRQDVGLSALTLDWTPGCILLVEMSDERYRIGELATLTGLTPDALRFYERQGVLDKPARTSGRFRVYSPLVVDRIRFIKKAQALGFTLSEIRELVQFNGMGGLRRCCRVRDLLSTRLSELEATLSELSALRKTLRTTLRQCETAIDTENASACPVIELKTHEERNGAT